MLRMEHLQNVMPDYWLPRPALALASETVTAFDGLLEAAFAHGSNPLISYNLAVPKWQFLCYAAEEYGLALHGSGNGAIARFEPRQPVDLTEFGAQNAVYAAADGIWPMYYAILDRDGFDMSLNNACVYLVDPEGNQSQRYYFFSINREALAQQPWRSGYVYLLPSATFAMQPSAPFDRYQVYIPQLASPVPVTPLARIAITPQDFPFLEQIRGHDPSRLHEYAAALNAGRPLPDF